MRRIITLLIYFLCIITNYAQENDSSKSHLKAIKNGTITYYADEGVDFTNQTFNNTFSLKSLKKIFRQYRIKKDDLKAIDKNLNYNNYYVSKNEKLEEGFIQYNSYYFIESKKNRVTVFWFGSVNKQDRSFERKYINRILTDSIPKDAFQPIKVDSIDFAGRILKLNSNSLVSAKKSMDSELLLTKIKKGTKVISEEIVDVDFEGSPTKATKVSYDIKGVNSLLAGMSGAKNLTVYYVATEVRGGYISCVMSFWNNDVKTDSGLAQINSSNNLLLEHHLKKVLKFPQILNDRNEVNK